MIVSADDASRVCLSCADIADALDGQIVTCRICGFQIAHRDYEILVRFGSDAAEYGYHYRRAFESDLESEELGVHYSLGIDEAWAFIALAVLSGLIGNLSTDAVKALVRRVKQSFDKRRSQTKGGSQMHLVKNQLDILDDEAEVDLFIAYISSYHKGFEGIDPRIIPFIAEEVRAGARTRAFCKLIAKAQDDGPGSFPREQLDAEIERQKALFVAARSLDPSALISLWHAVDGMEVHQVSNGNVSSQSIVQGERQGGEHRTSKRRKRHNRKR